MKKALIMCAAGMSSSLMASKTTKYLNEKGYDIEVEATIAATASNLIKEAKYDLYMISPQAKMYYDKLKVLADGADRPLVMIPPQAYAPIPLGIGKLAKIVVDNIK
ncbi:PTS cellobiose transporter subunit IIB [Helcococcus kunzii]|uniref:PTS EIIB type-3 domain-containing protein n=2 Tax=Helcococcus kunzii TaxID=40091 RepID=H3NP85_9FIRM|nr:PTS cellobiose transporter subunit IIB [Helcococcus kunzii]EHR33547.1 hypothetical protein HMPREF9709_01146 [Helcococcus kunzii ATCC 51366]QZO75758.1 PTS cellobiose transporter subunit IIB [Helcococcus kunzii]